MNVKYGNEKIGGKMKRIISVLIQMILMAMLISSATFSQNLIELTQYRTRYSKTFLDPATRLFEILHSNAKTALR